MEIEGNDGSKTLLKLGSEIEVGRGLGFKIDDRTVSRLHVSFQLSPLDESKACFKVIGKNPIWVHCCKSRQVSTFRTSERGEMGIGDMFCVSAKNPIWFTLKRAEFEAEKENNLKMELGVNSELAESLENSCDMKDVGHLEPESIDISHIDPVKEFGFLVIGQEFDSYPKKMILNIKNWNWFIEEPKVNSEDDEFEEKGKKVGRRKRKNRIENEDDEWTGVSEEEKEQLTNTRKVQKYLTRSRDRTGEPSKDMGKSGRPLQNKNTRSYVKRVDEEEEEEEEEEEDEEDDETLGGFIVDNDNVEEEEGGVDEEEEDFKEDEDDDEFDD